MRIYKDQLIKINTDTDRNYLLHLQRDPNLCENVEVVYIYLLGDSLINYPEKNGNIIYIGEACRQSEATGKRFAQHISTGRDSGGDCGTIYSLSRYYWKGQTIRLRIFMLDDGEEREERESYLLKAHVKEFGALPICQGTTGENYKTDDLNALQCADAIRWFSA